MRYKLDDLGWYQFEQLMQTLLKNVFGIGIEAWGGHQSDLGRDAYFKGDIKLTKAETVKGPLVFQMKFVENANAAGAKPDTNLLNSLKKEIYKINNTGEHINFKAYFLLTNVNLRKKLRKKICSLWKENFPNKKIYPLGGKDICGWLENSPNIRNAYPQILGLADLKYLLESAVFKSTKVRSKILIEQIHAKAKLFVTTKAFLKASETLNNKSFVVLEGPPEVGKTTIGQMLLLKKAMDGFEAFEIQDPEHFFQIYDKEKRQVYFTDDIFGSVEYDPYSAKRWEKDIDKIVFKLDKDHLFIWTTRKHILEMSLNKLNLKPELENFPKPADILVSISDLQPLEKAIMLYNHAKSFGLNSSEKEMIKNHAHTIVNNKHLTPFRIYRLINYKLREIINNDSISDYTDISDLIKIEIENPTKQMKKTFRCLPIAYQRLLYSMLNFSTNIIRKRELKMYYNKYAHKNNNFTPFKQGIKDLDGSFINVYGNDIISFIHPSLKNLIIEELTENKKERLEFLEICSLEFFRLAFAYKDKKENLFLLPDDEDWEILESRIGNLIKNSSEEGIISFYSTIEELEEIKIYESKIKQIYELTLKAFLKKYKNKSSNVSIELLTFYYRITKKLNIISSFPHVDKIYEFYKRSKINKYAEKLDYYKELIEFITLIAKYDNNFIENSGKLFGEDLKEIYRVINNEVKFYKSINIRTHDYEQLNYELDVFGELWQSLYEFCHFFPSTKWNFDDLLEQLNNIVYNIGQEMADKEPLEEEYEDFGLNDGLNNFYISETDDIVNISELFEDL